MLLLLNLTPSSQSASFTVEHKYEWVHKFRINAATKLATKLTGNREEGGHQSKGFYYQKDLHWATWSILNGIGKGRSSNKGSEDDDNNNHQRADCSIVCNLSNDDDDWTGLDWTMVPVLFSISPKKTSSLLLPRTAALSVVGWIELTGWPSRISSCLCRAIQWIINCDVLPCRRVSVWAVLLQLNGVLLVALAATAQEQQS